MKIKTHPEDFRVTEHCTLPLGEGPYAYYTLKKTNLTTPEALHHISQAFHIPLKHIGFAGMKDKHAITQQHISLYSPRTTRTQPYTTHNLTLMYIGRGRTPITLGMHTHNHFTITVRDLLQPRALTTTHIKNYHGEQRYSTQNTLLGKLLLQRNYAHLCEHLHIPVERNDFIGALKKHHTIKLLKLYIHAYQSHLWDTITQETQTTPTLPLIGYLTTFPNTPIEHAYTHLLARDNLTQRDFLFRDFPELSSEGSERDLYMTITNLTYQYTKEHDNTHTCHLTFTLPKGQYATTYIHSQFSEKESI